MENFSRIEYARFTPLRVVLPLAAFVGLILCAAARILPAVACSYHIFHIFHPTDLREECPLVGVMCRLAPRRVTLVGLNSHQALIEVRIDR